MAGAQFLLPNKPTSSPKDDTGEKYLISIVGPTASGKTELSLILAEYYQTEILSADSRQIYKEMNIGTAKRTKAELATIDHHFINHLSVADDYSAGKYEQEALPVLERLFEKHALVILVGGTGLYIDAVLKGLDKLPPVDKELREKLNKDFAEKGITYLQELLMEKDPDHHENVDLNNPQRLIRALEVTIGTGKPYSSFRTGQTKQRPFKTIKIGLFPGKGILSDNIEARVERMIEQGMVDEVISLLAYRNHSALQTVGYTELFEYMDGKYSLQEAEELIKRNTRRYAKRQMTWFKKDEEIRWFMGTNADEVIKHIETITHR